MNERIRELWRQAGGSYNVGNQHTWPQFTIDNPEKFAKLIMQDCMDCAKWVGNINDKPIDPADTAHAISLRIKNRFGIKE